MAPSRKPHVPKELLGWLKEKIPDRMPDYSISLENFRFEQGRVSVVRLLQHLYDEQEGPNKNVLG